MIWEPNIQESEEDIEKEISSSTEDKDRIFEGETPVGMEERDPEEE